MTTLHAGVIIDNIPIGDKARTGSSFSRKTVHIYKDLLIFSHFC